MEMNRRSFIRGLVTAVAAASIPVPSSAPVLEALKESVPIPRDPTGAWQHIALTFDASKNDSDRVRAFVDGVRVDLSSIIDMGCSRIPHLSRTETWSYATWLRRSADSKWEFYSDEYYVYGEVLGPDSFGQTNPDTGRWEPKPSPIKVVGEDGYWFDQLEVRREDLP